jgi:hypothetical protein
MSKKFLWFVLWILALVIISGGYYLWLEVHKVNSVDSSLNRETNSINSQVADWKIYKKTDYCFVGFEFKYPTEYQVEDSGQNSDCYDTSGMGFTLKNNSGFDIDFSIQIDTALKNNDYQDCKKDQAYCQKIMVDGTPVLKDTQFFSNLPYVKDTYSRVYEFAINKEIFRLTENINNKNETLETLAKKDLTVDEIIKTFKFVPIDSSANKKQ